MNKVKKHSLVDLEAECGIIGSLLRRPSVVPKLIDRVDPRDFSDAYNMQLFVCLCRMHDAGHNLTDFTVLNQELEAHGLELNAGYIAQIDQNVATGEYATSFAERVHDLSQRRHMLDLSDEIASRARDMTSSVGEAKEYAREFLESIEVASLQDRPRLLGSIIADLAAEMERDWTPGLSSGFAFIDQNFGLFQGSELTCIGARPGKGKTTFCKQIAAHTAQKGRSVLYVSLEMGELEFAKRITCMELGIDSRTLRGSQPPQAETAAIKNYAAAFNADSFPFVLWAPPRATALEIEGRARYIQATHGLDLLIVDHLQNMRHEDAKLARYQQIGDSTMRLKELAKELRIPVIVQSQLARGNERPQLHHLRESGDIEQNCDNVWFLHHEIDEDGRNQSEVIVAKFRHGMTASVPISFEGGKFVDPQTGSFQWDEEF